MRRQMQSQRKEMVSVRSLQLGRESVESVSRVPSQLHVMLTGAAGSAAGVNPFRFGMPRIGLFIYHILSMLTLV
jgi:hypothetical protein